MIWVWLQKSRNILIIDALNIWYENRISWLKGFIIKVKIRVNSDGKLLKIHDSQTSKDTISLLWK